MDYSKKLVCIFSIFIMFSISAFALDVEFLTTDIQTDAGDAVNISVLVTDNGTPENNTLVNFTTDLGVLSSSSVFSNASGIAEVSINSTESGTANINASSGSFYNQTNVSFSPLPSSSIIVHADSYVNTAGNITNITFLPTDIFGNINYSTPVSLNIVVKDIFGTPLHDLEMSVDSSTISYLNVSSDERNVTYVSEPSEDFLLTLNSTVADNITIYSTVGSVTNTTYLNIFPGSPGLMKVIYNKEYTVNTSSNISAIVYDSFYNPIEDVNISFTVTPPENTIYNSPNFYNSASLTYYNGTTDSSGIVPNVFTTDKRAGGNVISISVLNTSLQHNVTITGIADVIDNFFMSYTPGYSYSNNEDSYTLSARPADQFMNPIIPLSTPIKEQVRFNTDDGTTVYVPLNSQGRANTVVGPTPYIESLSVTATYKNESGLTNFTNSTTLYFTAGPLDSMDFYANPNAVLSQGLNGNHEANLTLVALDEWGHSLPNIHVLFNNTNTTVGTFTVNGYNDTDLINATTDSDGRIYGLFTGNVSGNTSILATSGNISLSTNISVKSEPFLSVSLKVKPVSVSSGSLVNITTVISIEGELPITRPAASAMLVLDRSGSMDPDYYAGPPLDVVLVLDRSGSMSGTPIQDARDAAKEFTDNLVSNSEVGIVSFASSSSVNKDMTLLNAYDNKVSVKSAIDSISDGGSTAMGEGMADANDLLINHGRSSARKVMIVLTDGETNAGSDQNGENAIAYANANDVTIYTIGLGSSLDEALLRHIASETDGTYYNAPDSSDLGEIYNTIAQELSDYDASEIEYGVEGFTPYDYTFEDSLELQEYTLKFDGYDLDTVFELDSGASTEGECLIKINGNYFTSLPSHDTSSLNGQWANYEYDLTNVLEAGSNTITFYDYHEYDGQGSWTSEVSDVEVYWNGTRIEYYSNTVDLDADGYDCTVNVVEPDYFEDTIFINETINDLKVQLDWDDSSADFDLQLTSPSGMVYGVNDNTTGYYPNSTTGEYIWIHPLSYIYPDDDGDTVEKGNWTVNVTGKGSGLVDFTITTYIDKKSATQLSSHAFMSSFDETRGDKAGLALYSYEDVVSSANQTSYVLANSTWTGYFTPDTDGYYVFNLSWDDSTTVNVTLYDGVDVLSSDTGTSVCEVSSLLSAGETYNIDVSKGAGVQADTEFTVNVSTTGIDTVMTAYYDSGGGGGTPKIRTWDGTEWSSEDSANYIGASPSYVVLESSPTDSEIIMATSDTSYDVNVQVWDGSSWGTVSQFSNNLDSYGQRGFDLKYEQVSGDAIITYMDKDENDGVPMYRVWDGSSWSSDAEVDDTNPGDGDVGWIRLEANPDSDEMILVTLDDERDMRAQVWDGDSWGNPVFITDDARATSYQCFDVVYEQDSGRAMVVWSDMDTDTVRYRIWNGNSWSSPSDMYTPDERVYWIKMAADPYSDDIILAAEDRSYDIYVTDWDGSSWETPLRVERDVYEYSRRSVDVAFEQSSGTGIVVWGESNSVPKYRTWDGSSWSSESSASSLGSAYTRWVQLTPDPSSDAIFLMASDGYNDLNIQRWDGSSWDIVTEVESSSSRYYECFDIVFSDTDQEPVTTPVSWNEWTGSVTSTFENDSLSHLENAIDTITADGLTAIDEGLYLANNELSSADGNSTIVIMTDGLDNAGYHSLLEEAYRAKDNDTVIYTVGFGNSEAEVDPILEEIATITGGEYYFAPNSSVLKDIFQGIAMQITNFSAGGPVLDLQVPHNYITPLAVAKATYQSGSSNATTGNQTVFYTPTSPPAGNAEPTITTSGSTSSLEWQLPNMGPGDKWGIWYQMKVDGAGYVPIIMPTSTVTYTDLSGENITVVVGGGGAASVGGGAASVTSYSLGSLDMDADKRIMLIENSTTLTLSLEDTLGNSSYGFVYLYSNIGYFGNYENPINVTVVGSDTVDFTSAIAGRAYITAYAYNINNVSDVLVARDVLAVRPKGMISIS
ncbi:VWA domain-containing protein [Methanolobus bombayensis]|uniref:VWA domain-containing protein n=1 Tax=Methanolobus bombayensis TaxID=38023 RepID=UPI001AE7A46C|nr:VWA domain-containing protein [Methanolobus bombayensis]MBP1910099.1 Mg-chelatase subunit ChlD [Methanolobus bombayensis]